MIITVTPNPSLDRTYDVGELRPGELHRARRTWVEASGKGVNVSRVLHLLGVPTAVVVTTGGDEGRTLLKLLGDLPVAAVPVSGATRVNVTVLSANEEPTKFNEPGIPLGAGEVTRLVNAVGAALGTGGVSWLCVSGSLPAGVDPGVIGRIVAVARDAGVRVAVDSSGPALAAAVEAGVDLVAPNGDELAELTGSTVDTIGAAVKAGSDIAGRTGGEVLVSLGGDGAVLLTGSGAWHASPPRIEPVNTTGAGDALLAGYLAADGEPGERLAHAVAIAASACLAERTADLPADLVDPDQVDLTPATGV